MNWDAIGAIGEIAGAIVVVATLVYLSRQISQNASALSRSNEYAQASSIHDTNALYVQIFALLVQDPEMASIYHRALSQELLDDVEAVRFASFINAYFAWSEDLYSQSNAELGFSEYTGQESQNLLESGYGYWGRLLKTDVGIDWWEKDAPYLFSNEFIQAINDVRSNAQGD